ncbi:MAG: 2-C-methyl-D-erythritol 2,4-cyclodiphosphate synthase [Idiomarina sp.]|nr:2-C-methyl-D-erythritol 2,4-cyclodiphosphate synthase [Idiomarina sp.]
MLRIGQGFDVHKFGGSGPVYLGGIAIDHEYGLIAHSDGDVLLHALCDALLGALALGDIGHLFPDTDQAYRGADSKELLQQVYQLVTEQGYRLVNADITLMAETPKLKPHNIRIRQCISELLQTSIDQISVKATTTEQLGFTGRKEGIACQATVLLAKSEFTPSAIAESSDL